MQLLSMVVFLILSLLSSLVMLFVSSLFWVWVMIDLSTVFMIPFLAAEPRPKKTWFTGVATYFLVQFFGSMMILYGLLLQWTISANTACSIFLCFGFSLKLGLVPLHFWVARSFNNFHYGGIFIVGAGQKVFVIASVPMFHDMPACAYVFYWMAVGSMLYGPVAMFNAIAIKSFLGYSSVNHTGFLVVCSSFSLHMVYIYSFVYCVSMIFLTCILWSGDCSYIKDLGSQIPLYYKTGFMSLALSFSGFPPFIDFCTKFVVLQKSLEFGALLAVFGILASSLINLLVWIWVASIAASGVLEALTPKGTIGQNVLNISCIIWNMFMGLGFGMLY
uniref:NADH-ubiquinone oxidoreductase chain 2 n=1 Tax=Magallana belcheri TaxID=36929 RepID=A0A343WU83_9BIVA|nr:NADH dehydrogenase subunit 2 [Crassostrea belcheri]